MNIKQLVWAIIEGWGAIILYSIFWVIVGYFIGWLVWG